MGEATTGNVLLDKTFWLEALGAQLARWFASAPRSHLTGGLGGWLALSGEEYAGFNVGCVLDHPRAMALFEHYAESVGSLPATLIVERLTTDVLVSADIVGAQHLGEVPFMLWDGAAARPPTGPMVAHRITTVGELTPAAVVMAASFSINLQTCINMLEPLLTSRSGAVWVGEEQGHVVSTAVCLRDDAIVGIFLLSTSEGQRRRGRAAALVEELVASCKADGARHFHLHTSALERNFPEEIGFTLVASPYAFTLNDHRQPPRQ